MEGEKEMKNSSPQKDMPISRNGGCAGAGENGNIITTPSAFQPPSNGPTPPCLLEDQSLYKKVVKYKECLKNHAAAIGGNATDGCGEFMPSGEQGTLEAFRCSACNCHRNFHRKEIDGECSYDLYNSHILSNNGGRRFIKGHHIGSPQGYRIINSLLSSRTPSSHPVIVSYRGDSVPSESDEKDNDDDDGTVPIRSTEKPKKRSRTKFTEDQKQKMLLFAENAGWKMQKLEESAVQRFCQEIGIKRRVLKVWMHNNKHHSTKKDSSIS